MSPDSTFAPLLHTLSVKDSKHAIIINYIFPSSALNLSKFRLVWEVDLLIPLVHTVVAPCSGGIADYFDHVQLKQLLERPKCVCLGSVASTILILITIIQILH